MNNLEKFDLQKALDGAELVTRDGREVTEWHYFKTYSGRFSVTAVVEDQKCHYTLNGVHGADGYESKFDLFIKSKVKETWVNVYYSASEPTEIRLGDHYKTREEAISIRHNDRYIKTIKITDEPE